MNQLQVSEDDTPIPEVPVQYEFEGNNLIIQNQVTDFNVFNSITAHANINEKKTKARLEGSEKNRYKKRKQQVCVQYKRRGGTSMLLGNRNWQSPSGIHTFFEDESLAMLNRLSVTAKSDQQKDFLDEESRIKSMTYHNPITIIQDLNFEGEEEVQKRQKKSILEYNESAEEINDPSKQIGNIDPQANSIDQVESKKILEQELIEIQEQNQKQENDELNLENHKLKQRIKQLELKISAKDEKAKQELEKAKTKAELLEEENVTLAKQVNEFLNIPKIEASTGINYGDFSLEWGGQAEKQLLNIAQTQTETTNWQHLITKLKEELALQKETINQNLQEKEALNCTIEQQQQMLCQYEKECDSSAKQKKQITNENELLKLELEKFKKLLKDNKVKAAKQEDELEAKLDN